MAHVLTGVVPGSLVYIYAEGKYRHARFTSTTGAFTVIAGEAHYPIRIAVRPSTMQRDALGNLTIGGADASGRLPGEESRAARNRGGAIDFLIASPDDWYAEGSPRVNTSRHQTLVAFKEVVAPSTPETDIYQRMPEPEAPPDSGLCVGFTVTEHATVACNAPHLPDIQYCEKHAIERGVLAAPGPVPADGDRCVWAGCHAAKFQAFVMCAEHAIIAGLVGAAPQTPVAPELPAAVLKVVGAVESAPSKPAARKPAAKRPRRPNRDPLAPRNRAPHKLDCACIICKHAAAAMARSQTLVVAAGRAEAAD